MGLEQVGGGGNERESAVLKGQHERSLQGALLDHLGCGVCTNQYKC